MSAGSGSGPLALADLTPITVAEMGRRAGRADFDRWAVQAQSCGHCARPIRLRGSTTTHKPGRPAGRGLRHPNRAGRGGVRPLRQPPGCGLPVVLA
jgi:hypothetical protein